MHPPKWKVYIHSMNGQQVIIIIQNHGFMQDQIFASRTCFGGHMDVNC